MKLPDYAKDIDAAYFDVDGTLTESNIVESLFFMRKALKSPRSHAFWKMTIPFRFFYWNILDFSNRKLSTRAIYGQYKGLNVDAVMDRRDECYEEKYKQKLYADAAKTIHLLKKQGTRIIFVSGSLDFLLQPLASEYRAELIACQLEQKEGVFTGGLRGEPVVGDVKVERIKEHAQKNQIDLMNCAAFGNSVDDIPMLHCVKESVAVNPSKKLTKYAKKQDWTFIKWS